MARALRIVSVERGLDPREFTLVAFGGAGPMHAAELALELGVRRVLVPPSPGVFSALGLLVSDYRHDYAASILNVDYERVGEVFEKLKEEALRDLASEGVPASRARLVRLVEARYRGQAYGLTIPYSPSLDQVVEAFHFKHEAVYGYSMRDEPVELVTARLIVVGLVAKPSLRRGELRPYTP